MERIECQWCRLQNAPGSASCMSCGAPLDVKNLVSDSGWREAPRLRDMTEFRFANSVAQVEGELVPVIDMALAPGDAVYFEHHVLLWKDEQTPVVAMPTQGGMRRVFGGMPFVLTLAHGPGRVAFSRDSPGELVVLPMAPGVHLDVRGHAFVLASHTIGYDFIRIQGLANVLHGGNGMYLDRFVTHSHPGLLVLHGYGNVFERWLRPGEKIMVEPGGFLYKDASVNMQAVQMPVKTGLLRRGMYLAEMTGPGRVGIQSMYVHHNAD
ncbi:AIM24 family protein [Dactylosporangium salmoneum]|uniref:AIM24 family protein n=1 Tax=Dactylosporangium salmoneum TaxID=53361 RepID=A0ABN3I350_9ACTN